jgi:hypothetical protein
MSDFPLDVPFAGATINWCDALFNPTESSCHQGEKTTRQGYCIVTDFAGLEENKPWVPLCHESDIRQTRPLGLLQANAVLATEQSEYGKAMGGNGREK